MLFVVAAGRDVRPMSPLCLALSQQDLYLFNFFINTEGYYHFLKKSNDMIK